MEKELFQITPNIRKSLSDELKYKLDIQYFADGSDGDNPDDEGKDDEGKDDSEGDDDDKIVDQPKYTEKEYNEKLQAELTRRLKQKEKEKADAIKEAEKLSKMNATQKQEYELEKLKAENAEFQRQINLTNMSKEASKMMLESGISPTDEVLEFVTADTAEETQKRVQAFSETVNKEVERQVAEKLRTGAPGGTQSNSGGFVSMEEILKIPDAEKRHQLIRKYHM